MQWKDQIRNQARIGHGISEASMPPTHLAARGTAPLVRICPTADSTITGLGCSSGCCGWFSQTPWVEPEACGGFKGALAVAAPLAGHGQKSSGREPYILGVGGAGRPRRLDGPAPGAILANCEGS